MPYDHHRTALQRCGIGALVFGLVACDSGGQACESGGTQRTDGGSSCGPTQEHDSAAPGDRQDAALDGSSPAPNDGSFDARGDHEDGTLPSDVQYPADLLDLSNWKLTVPFETDHDGDPDEYTQPELDTFSLPPTFTLNAEKNAVLFRAEAGGATTGGSSYPRSELREMTEHGVDEASWSTSSGTHAMHIKQAITHLPVVKPHVVAGQIHDAEDDVVMVRLEGNHLFVEAGGDEVGTLDENYELGTVFTVDMVAASGHIKVSYNGTQKVDLTRSSSGCYFKAGCYTQSNTDRGDEASAYGEVAIYELEIRHE